MATAKLAPDAHMGEPLSVHYPIGSVRAADVGAAGREQHAGRGGLMEKKRSRRAVRLIIDVWMTAGLMYSMGCQLFAPSDHEWSGAVLLVLFTIHHVMNGKWYSSLFRGKYTTLRSVSTAADAALLVFIILLMWSGIAMSQYVFTFLPFFGGMSLMRRLHLVSSGWAFVLMAFHLGLHWHLMFSGRKGNGRRSHRLLYWAGAAVAAYGLYVFFSRDFPANMFSVNEFAFLDYDEKPFLFYVDYSAAFVTFIFFGYGVRQLILRRKKVKIL